MILDCVCSESVEDDLVIEIFVVIEKSVVSGVLLMGGGGGNSPPLSNS